MSWLDSLGPDGEKLKEGFRAAQERKGDELTRRRIWSQISNPSRAPQKRSLRVMPALSLMVASGVVGVLVWITWPTGRGPVQTAKSTGAAVPSPTPAGEEKQEAFLQGPAVVRTGGNETMKVRLRGGARVALSTRTQLVVSSDDSPEVKVGQVTLEVPKQAPGHHFRVKAGPYDVVVVGTKFKVNVGSDSVGVEVQEGVVEVRRDGNAVRLEAGQNWTGWLVGPPKEKSASVGRHPKATFLDRSAQTVATISESPTVQPAPPLPELPTHSTAVPGLASQARDALRKGDADQALALFGKISTQSGVGGENALYEMGRIWRDHKHQPNRALELWSRYRSAHPAGVLRAEVDLSIVETYANVGDLKQALSEANAFLARYPHSERRAEVQRLQQLLMSRKQQGSL